MWAREVNLTQERKSWDATLVLGIVSLIAILVVFLAGQHGRHEIVQQNQHLQKQVTELQKIDRINQGILLRLGHTPATPSPTPGSH
jgi:hypothetical protein